MKDSIKFLAMDVDGTLTDGKIYMGNSGELFKAFHIKDGSGIRRVLSRYGIIPVIITGRESAIVENRCREIGVEEVYQGCRDKLKTLQEVLEKYSDKGNYTLANVAFMGDDLIDMDCMAAVKEAGGLTACPGDAVREIKDTADYVCLKNSGDGAVREFIDYLAAKITGAGLEKVRELSEEAYDFIMSLSPSTMLDGRYDLSENAYAIVQSYTTKQAQFTCYETHRKYIDVQYIIYGTELMMTEDIKAVEGCISKEYDEEKDVTFYDYNGGSATVLAPGDAMILYPQDVHRGGIAVGAPAKVKKIVIKVKVQG